MLKPENTIPTAYQFKNLINQRFGRLTVIRFLGKRAYAKRFHMFWLCRCDCGSVVEVTRDALTNGRNRSCGCLQREARIKHGYRPRHNALYASEYKAW